MQNLLKIKREWYSLLQIFEKKLFSEKGYTSNEEIVFYSYSAFRRSFRTLKIE